MQGYIFEVTNKKTGETYLGKKYAVSFDKKYFGEEANDELAIAIEKYGRPSFESKMIMPYETIEQLDWAYDVMQAERRPLSVVEEPKPRKRRTKVAEEK